MTKFQKFQVFSSIIPFYSWFFVVIVTLVELKKYNASIKLKVSFAGLFFLTGSLVSLLVFLMGDLHLVIQYIVAGVFLTSANILLVKLQMRVRQQATDS